MQRHRLSRDQVYRLSQFDKYLDQNLQEKCCTLEELIMEIAKGAENKWIIHLWVIAIGNYPSLDETYILRNLVLSSATEAARFLGKKRKDYLRAGLPKTSIEFIESEQVIDITETAQSRINSGIQRIVRNTCHGIEIDVTFVRWSSNIGLLIKANKQEIEAVADWDKFSLPLNNKFSTLEKIEKIRNLVVTKINRRNLFSRLVFVILRVVYHKLLRIIARLSKSQEFNKDEPKLIFDEKMNILVLDLMALEVGVIERVRVLQESEILNLSILVHDTLPLRYPEFFPEGIVGNYSYFASLFNRASALYVMTAHERIHLEKYLETTHFKSKSIKQINPPSYEELVSEYTHYDSKNRFLGKKILIVGSLEPRKNLANMLAALIILARKGQHFEVNIVYPNKWLNNEIGELVKKLSKLKIEVRFHYDISNKRLYNLYSESTLLLYCSFAEGLGLPPLEARAFKLPTILSNRDFMAEVKGYGGVITVDPEDIIDISTSVESVLNDFYSWNELQSQIETNIGVNWKAYSKQFFQTGNN